MTKVPKLFENVWEFRGERLEEARLALGLTRVELAGKVERSEGMLRAYEQGSSVPPTEVLQRAAEILRQPLSFFFSPQIMPTSEFKRAAQFRSQKTSLVRNRKIIETLFGWFGEIFRLLEAQVIFPEFDAPDPPLRERYNQLSLQQLLVFQNLVRKSWGITPGPLPNLVQKLETRGFIVQGAQLGNIGFSGISTYVKRLKRPFILVNMSNASPSRTRMNIAHEVAHILLHRNISTEDSIKIGSEVLENEANIFASFLLLDGERWRHSLRNGERLKSYADIKPIWNVSIKAMLYQMRHLEILDLESYSRLMRQYSSRGWNRSEPWDDTLPAERFQAMREASILLKSSIGLEYITDNFPVNRQNLAEFLGLEKDELFEPAIDESLQNLN